MYEDKYNSNISFDGFIPVSSLQRESFLCASRKISVDRWKPSCALIESFLYTGGKESFLCASRKLVESFLYRWKTSCALIESFLYAGRKFLVYQWKVSCAPVESFLYTLVWQF